MPFKYLFLIVVLLVLLILGISTRYDMVAMKMNTVVYLLDRWTGNIFLIDGFRKRKVVRYEDYEEEPPAAMEEVATEDYEEELPVPVVTDGN